MYVLWQKRRVVLHSHCWEKIANFGMSNSPWVLLFFGRVGQGVGHSSVSFPFSVLPAFGLSFVAAVAWPLLNSAKSRRAPRGIDGQVGWLVGLCCGGSRILPETLGAWARFSRPVWRCFSPGPRLGDCAGRVVVVALQAC